MIRGRGVPGVEIVLLVIAPDGLEKRVVDVDLEGGAGAGKTRTLECMCEGVAEVEGYQYRPTLGLDVRPVRARLRNDARSRAANVWDFGGTGVGVGRSHFGRADLVVVFHLGVEAGEAARWEAAAIAAAPAAADVLHVAAGTAPGAAASSVLRAIALA